MSANVESMFYVSNEENERFVPWHGLGTPVESAKTSKEAIELAGLNWTVSQKEMYAGDIKVPGYFANMRDSDNSILGVVGKRYQIVQNADAFDFTDSLVGEGCTYETAGSLFGGKRIWLLAKMPKTTILGDDVEPFICFSNSHDGSTAIKVAMTPIRVVCNNTLNVALKGAKRTWSAKHTGSISSKMSEAKYTLGLAQQYMDELAIVSDQLANTRVTEEDTYKLLCSLFPTEDDMSDRRKANVEEQKKQFIICTMAPDLKKFDGTAYQLLQAATDFSTHYKPMRTTENFKDNNLARAIDGSSVVDQTYLNMLQLMNKKRVIV